MTAHTVTLPRFDHRPIFTALAMGLLIFIYASIAPGLVQIMGIDWRESFMPAARAFLAGQNPYHAVAGFFNPAWVMVILVPFALIPDVISVPMYALLTLAGFIFAGIKLKAKPLALILFLLSPAVVLSFRSLNIDIFVLLGLLMPAPIGLFFVLLKPQIGIGIALYWLFEAWRLGGIRRVIRTFAPVTIALAITFAVYGNWISNTQANYADMTHGNWNFSLFPWLIPVGIFILIIALGTGRKAVAAGASPFFAPYVAVYSWFIALACLLDNDLAMAGAVAFMWIVFLIR